jgi:hypothetical protein
MRSCLHDCIIRSFPPLRKLERSSAAGREKQKVLIGRGHIVALYHCVVWMNTLILDAVVAFIHVNPRLRQQTPARGRA